MAPCQMLLHFLRQNPVFLFGVSVQVDAITVLHSSRSNLSFNPLLELVLLACWVSVVIRGLITISHQLL